MSYYVMMSTLSGGLPVAAFILYTMYTFVMYTLYTLILYTMYTFVMYTMYTLILYTLVYARFISTISICIM